MERSALAALSKNTDLKRMEITCLTSYPFFGKSRQHDLENHVAVTLIGYDILEVLILLRLGFKQIYCITNNHTVHNEIMTKICQLSTEEQNRITVLNRDIRDFCYTHKKQLRNKIKYVFYDVSMTMKEDFINGLKLFFEDKLMADDSLFAFSASTRNCHFGNHNNRINYLCSEITNIGSYFTDPMDGYCIAHGGSGPMITGVLSINKKPYDFDLQSRVKFNITVPRQSEINKFPIMKQRFDKIRYLSVELVTSNLYKEL
jgi:hypothetical protein